MLPENIRITFYATKQMKGEVNITVKGDTIIPAKFLGLFTWKYIDLPYEINEKVKIPI